MNEIRKVKSKTGGYVKIIEINAPIRFYWTENGFDGIEVTFNSKLFTPHQSKLFDEVLDAIVEGMPYLREAENPDQEFNKIIKRSFGELPPNLSA